MAETLQQLAASMKDCKGCRLCEERRSVVFGAGPADARVMLIGEGPGQNEDEQGLPFVGRAGQLLDRMLDAVDLSRERNVYIANMVKCRPPKNRDPQPDETEACIGFLREQVRLIRPKIVVCLGSVASTALIGPEAKITTVRGTWHEKKGTYFTATYHPAALLRDESKKIFMWRDLKAVQERLHEII